MDLKQVKKFITLAKKEGVASLSYESENIKISVKLPYDDQALNTSSRPIITKTLAGTEEVNEPLDASIHEVIAPFVGTFYGSSSPGEPSFVSVGSKVSKGETVCILEAMKIMNEIEADESGEIIEVCAENEEFVEYGQVLYRIKKS